MELQHIRNATLKIEYAGKTILVDPMFCQKETFDPFFPGVGKNPTVNLKMSVDCIIEKVDAVLLTHAHPDHFDEVAATILPKDTKLLSTPNDVEFLQNHGFQNIEAIQLKTTWQGITITRIEGQHGSGPVLEFMGKVSGFVLQSDKEPTIYLIGDSVLIDNVIEAIKDYRPKIIVTNSGGAIIPGHENNPAIMDEEQTISICKMARDSKVVATHIGALDFCKVTRKRLREYAISNDVNQKQLSIPEDGEVLKFNNG